MSPPPPGCAGATPRAHNPLKNGLPARVLRPGDHVCTAEPMVLSTLLGSCVAVCLFDPERGVMGMNHFLLATRHGKGGREPLLSSTAGRYGIHAMELLINGMLALGARRAALRAKAFGGGNVLGWSSDKVGPRFRIGDMNVAFVREFFAREGIPVVAEDLGGHCARQVHFTAPDFSVHLRRVPTHSSALVSEELAYLKRRRREEGRGEAGRRIDFW